MKRRNKKSKNPLLSIIIPTHNEEDVITACISSLQEQSYKKFEIIIVDDGSTDKTREIVGKFGKVKLLTQNHQGPGAARNLGAKKANGEILILVDADMTFHKDYLKKLIEPIVMRGVIGTEEELQYPMNLDNIWSKCWGGHRTKPDNPNRKIFRAIRRKDFLRLGGFDPKHGYADDQTLYFKYGIKSEIAKDCICYHNNPASLKEVYHQSVWLGASSEVFLLKIPIVNLIFLLIYVLLTPLAVVLLALKKCLVLRDLFLFPYMIAFMCVRYVGNLEGNLKRIFLRQTFR